MIDWEKLLAGATAQSGADVALELARLYQQRVPQLPTVVLYLANGPALSGVVVAADARRDALLLQLRVSRNEGPQVAYLRLSSLVALVFDDPAASPPAQQLIGGAAAAQPLPPVSRLNFRRLQQEQSTRLAPRLDPAFQLTTEESGAPGADNWALLAFYSTNLTTELERLLADPLGQAALRQKVRTVVLRPAAGLAAHLDGTQLVVSVPATASPEAFDSAALRTVLEQVL